MFESGEKKHKISKPEYEAELDLIREQLLDLQQQLDDSRMAALVILAGVDGSGKGDMLTKLNEWFDPRYMRTHAYSDANEDERKRPRHWRYWMNMPVSGHLGLEVFGWYGQLFSDCLSGVMNTEQAEAELAHINRLEKTLADNGILVIKIWLHLTRTQQIKKINKLAAQRDQTAKLTDSEKKHLKRYPEFIALAERVLRATHTEYADWLVLNGHDANYRRLTIARHLISRLNSALNSRQNRVDPVVEAATRIAEPIYSRLNTVDLSQTMDKKIYQNLLFRHQNKLGELTNQARHEGVGAVLVFEGWDASGKGGAIRRLTAAMDARNYTVIPIAAPSPEEKAHHYLWRFWKHVPRDGFITVYDRSWYGRVLVERVEALTEVKEWRRAYSEINEFERELAEHGILVIKFWLHISKEEQLRRFAVRENTRYKRYKITAEDYRNRAHWEAYEQAADEMLIRTDTPYAPWYVIPAENKYDARIRIFEHLEAAYQSRLVAGSKYRVSVP